MVKEIFYRGKNLTELKKMAFNDFLKLLPARQRRTLKRGFTDAQKKLLTKIEKANKGLYKKTIKTHCRDMIVLPNMVGLLILIHTGKDWSPVKLTLEMVGKYLGELTTTRKKVQHSAPGIGATRSSAAAGSKAK